MKEYQPIPARRSYTRAKLETQGRLLLNGEEIRINCRDFSGRGLGAFSSVSLPVRDKVKVEFSEPGKDQLVAKDGRIAWCEEIKQNHYRFGAEFNPGE